MYERAILRIGAVCLGVGLISVVVFEALHPAREDPNNNPLGRGPALSAAWAWLATAAAVTAAAAYGVLQQMTRWTPGASFPPATRCATTGTGWAWAPSPSAEFNCWGTPASSAPSRSTPGRGRDLGRHPQRLRRRSLAAGHRALPGAGRRSLTVTPSSTRGGS